PFGRHTLSTPGAGSLRRPECPYEPAWLRRADPSLATRGPATSGSHEGRLPTRGGDREGRARLGIVLILGAGGHLQTPRGRRGEAVANVRDRVGPQPPGTVEHLKFFYGPYAVPPGNDMNRFDVDLPLRNGFVEGIRASLVRASDLSRIPHGEAHIHHAHWLQL